MVAPTYLVAVEGIDIDLNGEITPAIRRAALRAINRTTRDGRAMTARRIRAQVNFTASYLGPNSGRLDAILAKSPENLEGRIRARTRPTSLARFSNQQPRKPGDRRQGVRVTVKPGVARFLRTAFIIPLRSGQDGALNNRGLAVRSDTPPPGAYRPTKLGENLWLLYGPSVSQVLYSVRNRGGVADEVTPELAEKLEAEFLRQLDLSRR